MLRTLPAGSSTLLLGREMFNIGQCGFITFHYFRKNKLISYCSGRKIRKQKQHEATIPKPRIPRDSSGFLGIPRSPQEVFAVACLCSIPMVSAFAAALLCCAEPSGPSGRHPAWPSSPRYFQVLAVFAVLEALGLNRVY